MFSWTKFEHDNSSVIANNNSKQCANSSAISSTADKEKVLADKEVDAIIKQSKSNIINYG